MSSSGFRRDIQGLRAVAVLLVIVYHAGLSVVSGGYVGVDVFFVISGFLITSHLVDRLEGRGLGLADFYARRVRRLLPASLVVLVLTVVAVLIWASPIERGPTLKDAVATALYVPNIWFAAEGTDYLAGQTPSPFQHYWSLGVEEQFYLVWPLLLIAGYALARRSAHPRRVIFALLAVVVAVSFVAGLVYTEVNQPIAFFMLPFRAWELGVGGLLALLIARARALPPAAGAAIGWGGLAVVGYAALAFESSTPFPGWAAAVPVLGTAMIIAGGASSPAYGVNLLLERRPMTFVGDISYSAYLVHWPLLIVPQSAVGWQNPLPLWLTLSLGALSLPLAWLCYRFVEQPGRNWRGIDKRRTRWTFVPALAVTLVLVGGSAFAYRVVSDEPISSGREAPTVADSIKGPEGTPYVPSNMRPSLEDAADDNADIYASGCHQEFQEVDGAGCTVGPDDAPSVALFGDSHSANLYPALAAAAEQGRLQLTSHSKSACPSVLNQPTRDGGSYPQCVEWRQNVIDDLQADPPDVVLLANSSTSQLELSRDEDGATWRAALQDMVDALPDESRVMALRPTPRIGYDPVACLSQNLDDALECAPSRETALGGLGDVAASVQAEVVGDDGVVDLSDYLCGEACPPVIGTRLVYRDESHMTATFAATLDDALVDALGL